MSNVLNRKMFVRGYRGGSQIRTEPRGARPTSVYEGGVFDSPLVPFDFLGGYKAGVEESAKIKQMGEADPLGSYPYITRGIIENLKQTTKAFPEKMQDLYNITVSPLGDIVRGPLKEIGIGFGLPRSTDFQTGTGSGFRFKTEKNPYGFPDQLGMSPALFFAEKYPLGSDARKKFLFDAIRQPNFQSDLSKIGVTPAEIRATEKALVEEFKKARERGLSDPEAAAVYNYPKEEQVEPIVGKTYKDVKTGDLSLMEELAKEGPFKQAQRIFESPVAIDARTKKLAELIKGEGATKGEVSEEEKSNLEGNSPAGEPGSNQNQNSYENEVKAEIQSAKDQVGEFNFEDEVDRLKKVLSEQTKVEDPTTPALMLLQLASNLMSGKTSEKGFAGFLDVLGQASGPVLDTAIKLSAAEKERQQEIGASAVGLALEKEKNLLDYLSKTSQKALDLTKPFDQTKYAHKLIVGPDGGTMGYDTSALPQPINNLQEQQLFTQRVPVVIDTADGGKQTIYVSQYEILDTKQPAEYTLGLEDPDGWKKQGGGKQLTNEILKNISIANSFKSDILADDESSFALVGAGYFVANPIYKAADIINAFTDDRFNANDKQNLIGAIEQIEASNFYNDAEKERLKENLLLQAAQIDYAPALASQADNLLKSQINIGGQMYSLIDIANAEKGTFKGQSVTPMTTNDLGQTVNGATVEGDEIIAAAKEQVDLIINRAAQSGVQYQNGQFVVVPQQDETGLSFNFGGKQFNISSKISQVQTYSTLMGFGFAQTIQPDQRLLKDTIEKSLSNFGITSLTMGPKQVRERVDLYLNVLEKAYNNQIRTYFSPDYWDTYKYFDGKRAVKDFTGSQAIMSGPNNPDANFNYSQNNINDVESSGQNNQQKDSYYNLTQYIAELERAT